MGIALIAFFLAALAFVLLRAVFYKAPESKPPAVVCEKVACEEVVEKSVPREPVRATVAVESAEPEWSRRLQWEERSEEWGVAAFIDCETTGLANSDEMVELALILFCFDRTTGSICGIADSYSGLREPAVEISPFAARVHHITPDMLAGKTLDDGRVERILERAEFLIAHNASFDSRFVSKMFPRAEQKRWLCSMHGIEWKNHGMSSRSLKDLLAKHGYKNGGAHRALADAMATLTLLQHGQQSGGTYLGEMLETAGMRASRPIRRTASRRA
jgi:DNA polymerase-3 subunit epsilon